MPIDLLTDIGAGKIAVPKVIVLTDIHMVPPGRTIIGIDPYRRLESAIRHIDRLHPDAARVVILGDLVHSGDLASYERVRDLLRDLAVPVSLLIGNHDHRPTFLEAFPGAPRDAGGFIQSTVDIGDYRLVMLDSLSDPAYPLPSGACGYLCEQRLAWLEASMAAADGRRILLFLHHPPMVTGFPGMDRIRLAHADRLLDVVRRNSGIAHIFAGHIHRTIGGSWHGIPFSIFKSPVHQQPMDLVTADSSLSVAEPPAYGIVLLAPSGVIVHTDDFELAAPVPDVDPALPAAVDSK